MVDVGDSLTHVNWAVDNVLTHYLDDYSFDYDVNGDQVQDSMISLGYVRLRAEGSTLWVVGRPTRKQIKEIKDFSIENGFEPMRALRSGLGRPL